MNNVAFDEYDILRSIVMPSYYEFVKEFWDTVVAEKPIWNWHIKYICGQLQKIAERVFEGKPKENDLIVNVPPGSTKSIVASIMYLPWIWIRMPSARFIGGSHAHTLQMDLSRKSRDVIKSDKYRAAFPYIKLRDDQDTKSYFVNTRGGSRYAVGVCGSVVGMHGHFLVVDDPIDPEKAVSEVELKKANRWMNDTLSKRKVEKVVTPTILIMQRLHQDDPTANMLERAKVVQREEKLKKPRIKHICLPAIVTDRIKPAFLKDYYVDNLLDPIRLPHSVLVENHANGEYSYSGQFLQWPVPLGGGMFKVDRIKVDTPSNKWKRKIRYWDNAGSEDEGTYTVGLLMGQEREGRFWILDVQRGRWSSEKRESIKKRTAQIDGPDILVKLEQEPGSGGKDQALATVRNLAGFNVLIERPTGDKTSRADPFSVQVNNGNVYMVEAEWNFAYLNELQFFPYSKYKDQVDASSGAFNELTGSNIRAGAL